MGIIVSGCRPADFVCLQKLCFMVCEILIEEANIVNVSSPVTICGDIHGQVSFSRWYTKCVARQELIDCICLLIVLRSRRIVSKRRWCARHAVHLYGRFRRSWVLLIGNVHKTSNTQSQIPRSHCSPSWQSWNQANYTSVWILWWGNRLLWTIHLSKYLNFVNAITSHV